VKDSNIPKKKKKEIIQEAEEKINKNKTMKLSIKEGSFTSLMTGFGESYISPFAIALKANNFQIGLLSSFTGIISPISQMFGSKLMEKNSRKKIIVSAVTLQALMWIPILVIIALFYKDLFLSYLPWILIAFYSLYFIFGALATPSWFSLMGDLVPEKTRGRYFGKRNKIIGIVALFATILGALILDLLKTKGLLMAGFAIIFFISCISRLISSFLFRKHCEPKLELSRDYYFSFIQFIKKASTNNFGKFVIYIALIHFATMIAGPFFAVYMLRDLGFSYTLFMLINMSASVFSLLFMPIWGKFSDKYGNRELIKIGSILIPFMPILWLFSPSPYYLAFVPQLIGGIGWAAFNLGANNFIYDSVSPQRRGICISYFNMAIGIGTFLGAGIGGYLAQNLNISFMNIILFMFLISGIARILVFVLFFKNLKEVRKVKSPKSNPIKYLKEINPVRGIIYGMTHGLISSKKIKKND
jgi:MFS family permease